MQSARQASRRTRRGRAARWPCRMPSSATAKAPRYKSYIGANDFFNAGEVANELARVCLESGNADQSATWYRRGYEAGLKEPNITPARKDLWEFRWEHAQARIAARRGQNAEAQKHVAAAKAI